VEEALLRKAVLSFFLSFLVLSWEERESPHADSWHDVNWNSGKSKIIQLVVFFIHPHQVVFLLFVRRDLAFGAQLWDLFMILVITLLWLVQQNTTKLSTIFS
jgi:hypothetical protein